MMRDRGGAPFAALLAAFACGMGCSAGEPGAGASADLPAARYTGIVDLTIGSVSGADPYIFGRVSGVALDAAGRIIVVDAQADEARVFSHDGEFLFSIGGSGAGPGELSGPCCPAFGPDGRLWIRDGGNARYNAYRVGTEGSEPVASIRIGHGAANLWAPVTFDPAGFLIDIGTAPEPGGGPFGTVRFHLDSTSAVVRRQEIRPPPVDSLGLDLVEVEVPAGRAVYYFSQPYGPTHLVAHAPAGGWATALSSRYVVEWHTPDDSTARVVARELAAGPELTPDERGAAEERLLAALGRFGMTLRDLSFEVPDRKVPLKDLYFDAGGRLWVELNVAEGEPRRADVFTSGGEYTASVAWPAAVDLSNGFIRPGVALGLTTDSLGVQRVARLRLKEVRP